MDRRTNINVSLPTSSRRWRTYWRTTSKIPANRHVRVGLESSYPSSADRGPNPSPSAQPCESRFRDLLACSRGGLEGLTTQSMEVHGRLSKSTVVRRHWRTTGAWTIVVARPPRQQRTWLATRRSSYASTFILQRGRPRDHPRLA